MRTRSSAAKERDYNTIDVPTLDPFAIESELLERHIETPAAPQGFIEIRAGGIPREEDRERMIAFMAMQWIRVPSRREENDRFTTDVARRVGDLATATDAMFEAQRKRYPELADVTREEARTRLATVTLKDPPAGHLSALLPAFGTIVDLLAARSWCILEPPEAGAEFVCCDDPVVLMPSGTRDPSEPRGFGNRDAEILMPVGRRNALLGVWPMAGDAPTWMRHAVDDRIVATMNAGTVLIGARRFVVSASDDFVWLDGDEIARRSSPRISRR